MIKAIIFDMDGVLIDSVPLWRQAEREVFAEYGFFVTKTQQTETLGLSIREIVSYWSKFHDFAGASVNEVAGRIEYRTIELINEKGKMIDGIEEVLRYAYKNFSNVGLASSSSYSVINAILTKLNFKKYFSVVRSVQDEKFGKPNPAVYISVARKFGVFPWECLVLEDSLQGVLAAKSARAKCIALPNKYLRGDSRFIIADYVFTNPERFSLDALDYIKKNL